jgi:superoxide dismutase, Cu-Zn family
MHFRSLLLVPALVCATAAFGQGTASSAHADIVNAQGQKIGTASFVASQGGVRIDLDIAQLPPGVHGIHIHAAGKCEGPDFKTAGGHFNPEMKKHGKDSADGAHAGDLLNITVPATGAVKTSVLAAQVTLGPGPDSLFHEGSSAIVIHEKEDDYKTDPSGNSGARIACGVIQR